MSSECVIISCRYGADKYAKNKMKRSSCKGRMRLALCVLIIAIVSSFSVRFSSRVIRAPGPVAHNVVVMFACRARWRWMDTVLSLLSQANSPRFLRIKVMLECCKVSDTLRGDVAPELRSIVQVSHTSKQAPDQHSCTVERVRRLIRRFVKGDERLIVVLDARARLVRGWDSLLMHLLDQHDVHTVLSSPPPSDEYVPTFPTLRPLHKDAPAANGALIARGPSRRFCADAAKATSPSVCWCAELTACRPAAWREVSRWHRSPLLQSLEMERCGNSHVAPRVAVLQPDKSLERAMIDLDEGTDEIRLTDALLAGATERASDAERIAKYGSSRAAKLAIRLAAKSDRPSSS